VQNTRLEVIQDKLNKQTTSTDSRAKAAEYGLILSSKLCD
jgi:outer membrane lipopolysaccharide assembly protein LptE/RlpB